MCMRTVLGNNNLVSECAGEGEGSEADGDASDKETGGGEPGGGARDHPVVPPTAKTPKRAKAGGAATATAGTGLVNQLRRWVVRKQPTLGLNRLF